jgi:hypothetical protein
LIAEAKVLYCNLPHSMDGIIEILSRLKNIQKESPLLVA